MKPDIRVEVVSNGYVITATWNMGKEYRDRIERKYVAYNGADLDTRIEAIGSITVEMLDKPPTGEVEKL